MKEFHCFVHWFLQNQQWNHHASIFKIKIRSTYLSCWLWPHDSLVNRFSPTFFKFYFLYATFKDSHHGVKAKRSYLLLYSRTLRTVAFSPSGALFKKNVQITQHSLFCFLHANFSFFSRTVTYNACYFMTCIRWTNLPLKIEYSQCLCCFPVCGVLYAADGQCCPFHVA